MADRIRAIIAAVARLPVERIEDGARLADIGLGSSMGISILRARLKNELGHDTPDLTWKSRIADVMKGGAVPAPASPAPPAAAGAAAPRIGIDLQEVSALPDPGDPFYGEHFSAGELAAARDRPDWRQHLCGIWCAKEAARKASATCAALRLSEIEVVHDAGGRPAIRLVSAGARALRVDVSITHTDTAAAAVALAFE